MVGFCYFQSCPSCGPILLEANLSNVRSLFCRQILSSRFIPLISIDLMEAFHLSQGLRFSYAQYEWQHTMRSSQFCVLFGPHALRSMPHTFASYLNKVMNKIERQTTQTVKKLWSTQLTFWCEPYQTVALSLERLCPMPMFHV